MAPSNPFLMDEHVQQQLAAHDQKLIKGSTVWFPGETPEVHWDFHRPKELELLGGFLNGFSDIDYRDRKVTVTDACRATYGMVDEYLVSRIAGTHLNPASQFNKTQMNGQVAVVASDGATIVRDDRLRVAMDITQEAADRYEHRVTKAQDTASKSLKLKLKRSLRIAPGADVQLKAITEHATDNTAEHQRNLFE